MAKAGRGDDQYMVRFPPGLRDRIKDAAEDNGRSMNSEIIATLEEAYPAPFNFQDLVRKTEEALRAVQSSVSAQSMIELHNILAEAAHTLRHLDEVRHAPEDQDPKD